jgi:ABC-type multidrug transport system fused ATPase/permease subunit
MNDFSCKFEVGKQTAIVGPSGSGKSTTIQLVERFYDATEGQVLIDGKDIKSINLRNYRQQIGYVGQEPVLFNTSIKRNILMGKPDATDAEIEDALRKTNSWDFVSKYPNGIN